MCVFKRSASSGSVLCLCLGCPLGWRSTRVPGALLLLVGPCSAGLELCDSGRSFWPLCHRGLRCLACMLVSLNLCLFHQLPHFRHRAPSRSLSVLVDPVLASNIGKEVGITGKVVNEKLPKAEGAGGFCCGCRGRELPVTVEHQKCAR